MTKSKGGHDTADPRSSKGSDAQLCRAAVCIVGGGPAGASVAIDLARRSIPCIVLESSTGPAAKIGECLPPNSQPLLHELGLIDPVRKGGHLVALGRHSAWGSSALIERDYLFSPYGGGWHLDRARFEGHLADRAISLGADYRYGSRVVGPASSQRGGWSLEAAGPHGKFRIECDSLVDASGRPARFARQLGATQIRYDTQIAIWSKLEPGSEIVKSDAYTLVESVKTGWWYSSRLPDGALMIIYFTDRDLADVSLLTTRHGWAKSLDETDHTRRRITGGIAVQVAWPQRFSSPKILAANNARLNVIAGDGWLAVGDAATAFDPLSSYGMSASLAAGARAGEAIARFLRGHASAIKGYAARILRAYDEYLALHRDHYLAEARWRDEPYWLRRHKAKLRS
ncbi:MAG TPA: tryptophan 7-halogenase [Blastocatellia bacterium]